MHRTNFCLRAGRANFTLHYSTSARAGQQQEHQLVTMVRGCAALAHANLAHLAKTAVAVANKQQLISMSATQDLGEMDHAKGASKAVDKYREELVWSQLVHSKWVTGMQYISELEAAVSCSLDSLLWIMDIERRCACVSSSGSLTT